MADDRLNFSFLTKAQAKGRPRFNPRNNRTYTPAKTKLAEHEIKALALSQLPPGWKPRNGPISLRIDFYALKPKKVPKERCGYPMARPDIDNLVKTLTDAFNRTVWYDDSQVIELYARKWYAERDETKVCVEFLQTP